MLKAIVVPEFKKGNFGDGVLHGVEAIGDRLRGGGGGYEVAAGNVYGRQTTNEVAGWIWPASAGCLIALSAAAGGSDEQQRRTCKTCGAIIPVESVGKWTTTIPATNTQNGKKIKQYSCEACGTKWEQVRWLPKYDSVRYDIDGVAEYYNEPRESSGGDSGGDFGGSSDGGGGGGADW